MAAVTAVFLLPGPLRGQSVFGWPARADPRPEALLTGAAATLWNPAGSSAAPNEAWLLSIDGPEATGIRGAAAAVTAGVPGVGTLGIGFSHLGISDIPRTLDSPASEPGDIDVVEDAFSLSLSRHVGTRGSVGLTTHWVRAEVADGDRTRVTAGLGGRLTLPLPLEPTVAAALLDLGGDERVLAALSASVPQEWVRPFSLDLGYGIDGWTRNHTFEQRVSLLITWRASVHVGMGLTLPDDDDEGVTPLWMAGADFGRYSLGVLREELSNDFGAVHYYRLAIRF